jgi:hypothetical protein
LKIVEKLINDKNFISSDEYLTSNVDCTDINLSQNQKTFMTQPKMPYRKTVKNAYNSISHSEKFTIWEADRVTNPPILEYHDVKPKNVGLKVS